MLFGSSILWALVISTANGLRSCEDCVEHRQCPQIDQKMRQNYTNALRTKLKNAMCGTSSQGAMFCCSDFNDDGDKDEIENHPNVHLLSDDCGTNANNRIIGGDNADMYEFPWLVLLFRKENGVNNYFCGGTLINSRYVLTAAHCLKDNYHNLKVRVGEHDLSKEGKCFGPAILRICEEKVQDIDVSHIIKHPKYSEKTSSGLIPVNDIGLLRLKEPVDLCAENAGLICLPVSRRLREIDLPGNFGQVAGWGWTVHQAKRLSNILQKSDVPIHDLETCSFLYLSKRIGSGEKNRLFTNVVCADERGKGTCKGDSGGPLMLQSEDNMKYTQYGIVSYGSGCGSGIPSVYTDVRKYLKWILDTIKP